LRRAALTIALLLCACGGGVDSTGTDALLRVPGGQFIPGPPPQASGGPAVLQASINRVDVTPGLLDRTVTVTTPPGTSGVLLAIQGDVGYWVVPAGGPDPQQSNQLKNQIPVNFSPALPAGSRPLLVQATTPDGAAGAAFVIPLQASAATQASALSFTLSWDTEADLDLHVVDPLGNEIYWDHVAADGGVLDFDSNQSCVIDGLRRETVSWTAAPPSGRYQALVDTPSLCTAATAHWKLQAQMNGAPLASVEGQSTPFDTRGFHARGAGLLALELDVP
jgi:hypothetical protein